MSELRLDTYEMPGADLGPEDALPRLGHPRGPHGVFDNSAGKAAADIVKMFQYGQVPGCLPYRVQSSYNRVQTPRSFRSAVLENDILRATFLLDLGGRLWSLIHKPTGRELMYCNPVFQPANMAIRNAWFAGGVEWNIGIRGHSVFTCAPLFAARLTGHDGSPVLRLYEWERIRRTPFQIDCSLPEGSPFLFVRMRVVNPLDEEIPMYWWSNIAVPEEPGSRVIAPATTAYKFTYDGKVRETSIPVHDGLDRTYAAASPAAADDFYRIPDDHQPWVAWVDKGGRGLVHTSTAQLRGRKMFRWGIGPGGRQWQRFLCPPDGDPPYIEIQAGLGRTQAECLPMPPGAEWEWLEAYGSVEVDPKLAHSSDWQAAVQCVEEPLVEVAPLDRLDARLAATAEDARRAPDEVLHRGSGWGALERRRREQAGERPFCDGATPFDDEALGAAEAPWLALLEQGALPEQDPAEPPVSWMVQPEWRRLLETALSDGQGVRWVAWLHLGVMAYYVGEVDAAITAHQKSIELEPSAWAYRNLGVIALHQKRHADAAELYLSARLLRPDLPVLALECCRALLRAEQYEQMLGLLDDLPQEVRTSSRIVLCEARAHLELGRLDDVARILERQFEVHDLREGEVSLTDLWFGMHERRIAREENVPIDDALADRVRKEFPPPAHLDFRMHTGRRRRRRKETV